MIISASQNLLWHHWHASHDIHLHIHTCWQKLAKPARVTQRRQCLQLWQLQPERRSVFSMPRRHRETDEVTFLLNNVKHENSRPRIKETVWRPATPVPKMFNDDMRCAACVVASFVSIANLAGTCCSQSCQGETGQGLASQGTRSYRHNAITRSFAGFRDVGRT